MLFCGGGVYALPMRLGFQSLCKRTTVRPSEVRSVISTVVSLEVFAEFRGGFGELAIATRHTYLGFVGRQGGDEQRIGLE